MAVKEQVWGSFENNRELLFEQFQDVHYDPETGLNSKEIRALVDEFLAHHQELPRVLQKAHTFRIVLSHCRLHINPYTWFVGDFEHGNLLAEQRSQWLQELEDTELRKEADWFELTNRTGTLRGKLDVQHLAPGWENLFRGGLSGLIQEAELSRSNLGVHATKNQLDFLEAVTIACSAAKKLAQRFADYSRKLAEQDDMREDRYLIISSVLDTVPAEAPNGIQEALQAIWLFQTLVEFEGESTMSLGHFDRMLFPYYQNDIESGKCTKDQVKELLKYFWFKYQARRQGTGDSARNFTLGGQTETGADAANELTFLALDAFEELNTPDPKISMRFHAGTDKALRSRVAELIQRGNNSIVIMNDEPSIAGLVLSGKSIEDARGYLSIGCYEPAIDGKDMACTMNIPFNMAKCMELALNNGIDPLSGELVGCNTGDPADFENYQQVYDAYIRQMDFLLERAASYLSRYETHWPEVNPSPLIAATMADCIGRGKDIGEGGCRYNSVGCPAGALAEAADSLSALKSAIYETGQYTMAQVLDALKKDFIGYETMRSYFLNHVPKWGNGIGAVDSIAKSIADHYCEKVATFRTPRGGGYQPGLFALHFQWTFGKKTGALPCGRKAETPTSPGIGAGPGMDKGGITALMNSVETLDFSKAPDGSVLDIMLHPSAVKGAKGINTLTSLINTHFSKGGNYLQFNLVDTETLEEAQRFPERFPGLQVRVTGYSAYFTKLSRYEQDLFIRRNKHLV